MHFFGLAGASALLAAALCSSGAMAQDIPYDCQNDPLPINIPAGRLDSSLNHLRLATRCPISGTRLAGIKRVKALRGTYTPTQALSVMLRGTGLQGRSIKQGLEVSRARR